MVLYYHKNFVQVLTQVTQILIWIIHTQLILIGGCVKSKIFRYHLAHLVCVALRDRNNIPIKKISSFNFQDLHGQGPVFTEKIVKLCEFF